jgi:hypothetical protein
VVGSIWLGRRTPGWGRWQRRVMYVATAFLVVVGIDGFVGLDDNQRWGWPGGTADYVEIGWLSCEESGWIPPEVTYPRCLEEATPWWMTGPADPAEDQE